MMLPTAFSREQSPHPQVMAHPSEPWHPSKLFTLHSGPWDPANPKFSAIHH
jgi:hypothetical protein